MSCIFITHVLSFFNATKYLLPPWLFLLFRLNALSLNTNKLWMHFLLTHKLWYGVISILEQIQLVIYTILRYQHHRNDDRERLWTKHVLHNARDFFVQLTRVNGLYFLGPNCHKFTDSSLVVFKVRSTVKKWSKHKKKIYIAEYTPHTIVHEVHLIYVFLIWLGAKIHRFHISSTVFHGLCIGHI